MNVNFLRTGISCRYSAHQEFILRQNREKSTVKSADGRDANENADTDAHWPCGHGGGPEHVGSGGLDPAERLPQPQPEGYVLRAYCGRVAIYMPNGAQPVETTDIELKNLPSADQRELKTGSLLRTWSSWR
jgi:hypothetical protein